MTAQQLQINNDKLDQYRQLSQINLDFFQIPKNEQIIKCQSIVKDG